MFGKARVRQILRQCHERPAAAILQEMIDGLSRFRGAARQKDDVTMVLIKATGGMKNLRS